jgi:hypothetical protein
LYFQIIKSEHPEYTLLCQKKKKKEVTCSNLIIRTASIQRLNLFVTWIVSLELYKPFWPSAPMCSLCFMSLLVVHSVFEPKIRILSDCVSFLLKFQKKLEKNIKEQMCSLCFMSLLVVHSVFEPKIRMLSDCVSFLLNFQKKLEKNIKEQDSLRRDFLRVFARKN